MTKSPLVARMRPGARFAGLAESIRQSKEAGSDDPFFPDTHPEAEAVLIRLLREAPFWRKLEMVDQFNQGVNLLALAGLRQRYPDENERRLRRRLADLLLGEELALKVYGPLSGEN